MKTLIGEQEKITVTKNELLKFKMHNKKNKIFDENISR